MEYFTETGTIKESGELIYLINHEGSIEHVPLKKREVESEELKEGIHTVKSVPLGLAAVVRKEPFTLIIEFR